MERSYNQKIMASVFLFMLLVIVYDRIITVMTRLKIWRIVAVSSSDHASLQSRGASTVNLQNAHA
jgi:hypothetical protein